MPHTSFDIQIRLRDHWVLEDTRETELMARHLATRLLADPHCAGVRILRVFQIGGRVARETEIFQELRDVTDTRPDRINEINDTPPLCHDSAAFTGPDSRHVMGRVFRSYLNAVAATPTEVMHNYRELVRIQDKGQLVWSGLGRIAELQAAQAGGDIRQRRDELSGYFDEVTRRANAAAQLRLPPLSGTLGELLAGLSAQDGPDAPDYLALTALSRRLLDTRSWMGKLQTLCQLLAQEHDPAAAALLDGVVADVLGTDVIRDLLGHQATLGAALCGMLDLGFGRFQPRGHGEQTLVATLNTLFAEDRLPISRRCLITRVHRQLRSAKPLHPRDPTEELGEFHRLLPRLTTPDGLLQGAVTAEAITARFARTIEQGGKSGRRAAVAAALAAMPDRAMGIVYLSALSSCADAAELMDLIRDGLRPMTSVAALPMLGRPGAPQTELLACAARAFRALAASGLPQAVRDAAIERIDALIEAYVIAEKVVERIDRPSAHLRERALTLVGFCGSGLLPEGRALRRARAHSLGLLRQPNFNERFVEGIADPDEAEAALRGLHRQLRSQPGFVA